MSLSSNFNRNYTAYILNEYDLSLSSHDYDLIVNKLRNLIDYIIKEYNDYT